MRHLTSSISRPHQLRITTSTRNKFEPPQIPTEATSDSAPSIFTAIQEQLGLKLESTKGPVETLVIDHIEEPSPN